MNPSLISLLSEIDKRTQGRIPDQSRLDLLSEIATHMDAAITARLEMGLEPVEAERQAVIAFGSPKEYIHDILRAYEQAGKAPYTPFRWLKGDRATMLTLAGACLYFTFAPFVTSRDLATHLLVYGLWVFVPLFLYVSWRARRVQIIPIAAVLTLGFVFLAFVQSGLWMNLYEHGGTGFVPRREVESTLAYARADIKAAALATNVQPRGSRAFLHNGNSWMSPDVKADRARETIAAIGAAEKAPLFGDIVADWNSNHDVLAVAIVVCVLLNFVGAFFGILAAMFPWEMRWKRKRAF